MLKRSQIATATLCAGLGISATSLSAHAQDSDLTAREKYDLAVELQAGGQNEQALQRLRQIDPMDLSDDVRRDYYERLAALDPNAPTAEQTPAAAEEVAEEVEQETDAEAEAPAEPTEPAGPTVAEQLDSAVGMSATKATAVYEGVIASDAATAEEKAVAKARLSQIQRLQSSANSSAKALIEEATEAIKAGDYDAAKSKLETAMSSYDDLGYYDQQRIETRLSLVNERLAAEAEARAAAAELAAAEAAAAAAAAQAAEQAAAEAAAQQAAQMQAEEDAAAQAAAEAAAEEARIAQEKAAEEARMAEEKAAEEARIAQERAEAAERARIEAEQAKAAEEAAAAQALSEAQAARTQELTSMGNAAFEAGEYEAALSYFSEAAEISGGSQELGAKIAATAQALSDQMAEAPAEIAAEEAAVSASESLLDEVMERQDAIKDAYILRFQERTGAAKRALDAGQYAPARDFANSSIEILDEGRVYLSQSEYTALRESALTLVENIDIREEQATLEAQRQAEADRAIELAAQRAALEEQRKAQVHELLKRALDLRKQSSYDAALAKAKEALFIDPTDVTAQLMVDSIEADLLIVKSSELQKKRYVETGYQQIDNLEAVIPYRDIITYPDNWPQITKQRLEGVDQSGGESAASRRTKQLLDDTTLATVSFESMRLATVINFLQTNTGANFFPNWTALELAGVDQDTPITLNMRNVSAATVLELTLQQASTDFEPVSFTIDEGGVVVVSTETALSATTDVRIYDIRDLLLPIYDNFSDAPEFDLQNAGQQQGGQGGGGNQNVFDTNNNNGLDELDEEREELILNLLTLIRDTVGDPLEWVANGGDVSSAFELRGRMVIRTTSRNHGSIRKLLTDFREFRSIAISIESRILLVDENFVEEIGVDFDLQITDLGGSWTPITIGQNSIEMAQRGSNSTPPTPARFQNSLDNVGPQTQFSFPFGVESQSLLPGGGNVPAARALDFSVGFLDDISANLIVRATQGNQRSVSLTAPRVTFLNGTSATVVISEQIAFISDLDVVPNAAAFDPEIGVVNSGVVLAVEGAVSADRRYVTMNIWPSLSSLRSPIRQIEFVGTTNTNNGGDGGEDVAISGFIEAPETTLTQVRTQVSVPDQGTLLLGGQRLVGEIEIEAGVPVLSKVPFLKRLFTNNSTVKDERTLLILVKPTILLQNEQEDRAFPGISNDPTGYLMK